MSRLDHSFHPDQIPLLLAGIQENLKTPHVVDTIRTTQDLKTAIMDVAMARLLGYEKGNTTNLSGARGLIDTPLTLESILDHGNKKSLGLYDLAAKICDHGERILEVLEVDNQVPDHEQDLVAA